jgi:hypothetical protein
MKAKSLTIGTLVVFSIIACTFLPLAATSPPSQPVPTAEQPIGSATGLHTLVEHALLSSAFSPLVDPEDMFNGDRFRVTQGGESLLDFGDSVRLHLFNDTATGNVRSKSAPGAPLEVSMQLEYGGFTGEVVEKDAEARFRTPGNATIYVHGTQFFITYDPETAVTYVGNFGGNVSIESGGVLLEVTPGHYRKSLPGEAPQASRPINLNMPAFEAWVRSELSPIKVSRQLDATTNLATAVAQTVVARNQIATAVAQTIAARVTPSLTVTPTASKTATLTPSHTPTSTLTPTSRPCSVYSYSLLGDGNLLLAFKFFESLSGNYTAVVDNQQFHCEILPQYPDRLYCHGTYPPVGKVVDINIYSFDPYKDTGEQICYKSFKEPFIPTPTPTVHRKKTKTPTPYSPYPTGTY